MLASLLLVASSWLPQGIGGDERAPVGLTVVVVDVGQGDGLVIRAPNGQVHVVDAGVDGEGNSAVRPVIDALAPSSFGITVATHYHVDHIGGLDEVLRSYPFLAAYDRGDSARPSGTEVSSYLSAAGARRRTVQPGQVFQLGGGATLTVLASDGALANGQTVAVAGTAQEENSRSIAMRLDYGGFSMWLGGDLTGGGNSTADVETPATVLCGDVDVYHVDHHGSNTSTNINLINRLAPELAVVSCGSANSYGHPTTTTINRINQANAARIMLSTSEGTGSLGFGVCGNIAITSDGTRYRAVSGNGDFLDFFVDEVVGRAPSANDLRISEVQRDPDRVPDQNGEYFEVTNIGVTPVSLRGVRISNTAGTFTLASTVAAFPGRPVLIGGDGWSGRNGGLPLPVVWPYNAIALGNSADALSLAQGSQTLDGVTWSAGFAGGRGVAAERIDLLAPSSSGNFAPAPTAYGLGDLGTPARRNGSDASHFPALVAVETSPGQVVLRAAALSNGGMWSLLAFAQGQTGFNFLGQRVPLDPDALFATSLGLPGFVLPLPSEGYRSQTLALPAPIGLPAFAAHLVFDANTATLPTVSAPLPFVFP